MLSKYRIKTAVKSRQVHVFACATCTRSGYGCARFGCAALIRIGIHKPPIVGQSVETIGKCRKLRRERKIPRSKIECERLINVTLNSGSIGRRCCRRSRLRMQFTVLLDSFGQGADRRSGLGSVKTRQLIPEKIPWSAISLAIPVPPFRLLTTPGSTALLR